MQEELESLADPASAGVRGAKQVCRAKDRGDSLCLPLIETAPARGLWLTKKWDSQLKRGVIERHRNGNTGLSLCACVCVCVWQRG